jgi:hypothetical protein
MNTKQGKHRGNRGTLHLPDLTVKEPDEKYVK